MFSLFQRSMILKFPTAESLRTVLGNKVSDGFRDAPARAGREPDGTLYVETAAAPPRAAVNKLKRLGVHAVRSSPVPLETAVTSWAQLVHLEAQKDGLAVPEQAVVLFDLPSGQLLSQMAIEVLRLGNDRQGFRWLGDVAQNDQAGPGARALLRVVGPPYYTLLRALSP